jgi:formylglycine-generating enzyme required for sulfatase activity
MKYVLYLALLALTSGFSLAQSHLESYYSPPKDTVIKISDLPREFEVLTSEIRRKPLIKTPEGMVYINPMVIADPRNKYEEGDTLSLHVPKASKFYFAVDALNQYVSEVNDFTLINGRELPYDFDRKLAYMPFYIKQWEVTNQEYRQFLEAHDAQVGHEYFPDTLCWFRDFPYSWNWPLQRHYRYHPAYNDHPVVGVSYHQAKAYCAWYEKELNKILKVDGYTIKVDLPNEFEWNLVNSAVSKYNRYGLNKGYLAGEFFYDNDFFTALQLVNDTPVGITQRALDPGYSSYKRGNFMDDGAIFTVAAHDEKYINKLHLKDEANNVYFLNSNVSEWMSENYQDNWKGLYEWRQQALHRIGTSDALLLAQLEKYYNANNDTINGQLVRGGNWFYEHHAYLHGVNVGNHSAKAFINPDAQHATLGFRYVVRLVPVLELSEN